MEAASETNFRLGLSRCLRCSALASALFVGKDQRVGMRISSLLLTVSRYCIYHLLVNFQHHCGAR
jgi:hypothetical protein